MFLNWDCQEPSRLRRAKRARHDDAAAALPLGDAFLSQDRAQLRRQAQRRAAAIAALQADVAHVAGHQNVGGTGVARRVDHCGGLSRHGEKRRQGVLLQLASTQLNRGYLFVGNAIRCALPWKTVSDRGDAASTAQMHPFDVGTS